MDGNGEPDKAPYVIEDGDAYLRAMQVLNAKNRPPKILRMIMNAFESYRQARKIGWSRPWNKYGVMTFRSYRLNFAEDASLVDLARSVLEAVEPGLTDAANDFVDDLLSDAPQQRQRLMGFLFYHEIEDEDGLFEGVTLSFGRVHEEKRHRDRLDFIFEAPLGDGRAEAFQRLRIFVDPYKGVGAPLWQSTWRGAETAFARPVFEDLCELYPKWEEAPGRLWDHWTSQYIDYFGPRRHFAQNSHFPISKGEAERLRSLIDA